MLQNIFVSGFEIIRGQKQISGCAICHCIFAQRNLLGSTIGARSSYNLKSLFKLCFEIFRVLDSLANNFILFLVRVQAGFAGGAFDEERANAFLRETVHMREISVKIKFSIFEIKCWQRGNRGVEMGNGRNFFGRAEVGL